MKRIFRKNIHRKKSGNRLLCIFFALFLSVILGMSFHVVDANRSYLGSNVLHLAYTDTETALDKKFQSAFLNTELYTFLMFRSLFLLENNLIDIRPDLASSYKVSEDNKTYEITLNKNMYWSDKTPLTVEDIAFTFRAILKAKDTNTSYVTAINKIVGATDFVNDDTNTLEGIKMNGNTISITLETPYRYFINMLSQIPILPYHILSGEDLTNLNSCDFWYNPVVSGMYKPNGFVDLIKEGNGDVKQYYSLILNENYSGELPNIEEVRLHRNYEDKRLDIHYTNNSAEIATLSTRKDLQSHEVLMPVYNYLLFNIESDIMKDINVRKAITYALDREQMLYTYYFNLGSVINSGMFPSYENLTDYSYSYSPNKAAELLSDFDFTEPITLLLAPKNSLHANLVYHLAGSLENIGFKVNITNDENEHFDIEFRELIAHDRLEWYYEYFSEHPNYFKHFGDTSQFDELINEAYESMDDITYFDNLFELQQLEQQLLYKFPLFTVNKLIYIYDYRLNLPNNLNFSSNHFKYNLDFKNWKINKQSYFD